MPSATSQPPRKSGGTRFVPALALASILTAATATADDWPTYRGDARRSGVTAEKPDLPLEQAWVRRSPTPPMTAWAGPAKWDAYSGNAGLQSMRNFDPAFFVTAAGGAIFFGSSVDHAVHCLDAATGEERWAALVGGAVRLPPDIAGGRAYFGADDGHAHCVDAADGSAIWKHRPASSPRLIPSDGKFISPWPVRTGVLVLGDTAFFGASLVPWEPTYLCAVDAGTGAPRWTARHEDMTLQGALLASAETLYAPQGRAAPLLFNRTDGARLRDVAGAGGTFCLLTEEEKLVAMPSSQKAADDVIGITDPEGGSARLSFAGADRLVVRGGDAFLHQRGKLRALDLARYGTLSDEAQSLAAAAKEARSKIETLTEVAPAETGQIAALEALADEADTKRKLAAAQLPSCFRWDAEAPEPFDLILAGETLFVGGDGAVAAFATADGSPLWDAPVEGKAYGLAFAGGRLFVSTSLGHIHAFAPLP